MILKEESGRTREVSAGRLDVVGWAEGCAVTSGADPGSLNFPSNPAIFNRASKSEALRFFFLAH